jgi:hypothetical protein
MSAALFPVNKFILANKFMRFTAFLAFHKLPTRMRSWGGAIFIVNAKGSYYAKKKRLVERVTTAG